MRNSMPNEAPQPPTFLYCTKSYSTAKPANQSALPTYPQREQTANNGQKRDTAIRNNFFSLIKYTILSALLNIIPIISILCFILVDILKPGKFNN